MVQWGPMPGLLFILGREPLLSGAELDAVLGPKTRTVTDALFMDRALFLPGSDRLDAVELIQSLGGTVKIGRVLGVFEGLGSMRQALRSSTWLREALPDLRHRVEFGVSVVGFSSAQRLSDELGHSVKRSLEELNHSARWIQSKDGELSSVVVAKNGLMTKGVEVLVACFGRRFVIATTVAVQPFRQWGERDYGRPSRDAKSGMLPPKLARMMVNLTGAPTSGFLLDPFCGSGTVLQEAWLRGYRKLAGSDISEKAVHDSGKNLAWLKAKIPVVQRDAGKLAGAFSNQSIDAIVTEPELGPPIPIRTERELHRRIDGLTMLYRRFLKSAAPLLAPRGRIVMAWPVFHLGNQMAHLAMREVVPPELHLVWPFHDWLPRTARQTLPYERPGQIVGREIVLLEKRSAPRPEDGRSPYYVQNRAGKRVMPRRPFRRS